MEFFWMGTIGMFMGMDTLGKKSQDNFNKLGKIWW